MPTPESSARAPLLTVEEFQRCAQVVPDDPGYVQRLAPPYPLDPIEVGEVSLDATHCPHWMPRVSRSGVIIVGRVRSSGAKRATDDPANAQSKDRSRWDATSPAAILQGIAEVGRRAQPVPAGVPGESSDLERPAHRQPPCSWHRRQPAPRRSARTAHARAAVPSTGRGRIGEREQLAVVGQRGRPRRRRSNRGRVAVQASSAAFKTRQWFDAENRRGGRGTGRSLRARPQQSQHQRRHTVVRRRTATTAFSWWPTYGRTPGGRGLIRRALGLCL